MVVAEVQELGKYQHQTELPDWPPTSSATKVLPSIAAAMPCIGPVVAEEQPAVWPVVEVVQLQQHRCFHWSMNRFRDQAVGREVRRIIDWVERFGMKMRRLLVGWRRRREAVNHRCLLMEEVSPRVLYCRLGVEKGGPGLKQDCCKIFVFLYIFKMLTHSTYCSDCSVFAAVPTTNWIAAAMNWPMCSLWMKKMEEEWLPP